MQSVPVRALLAVFRRPPAPPWDDPAPIRQELFSVERLEQHAESLAGAQTLAARPAARLSLLRRLDANAVALRAACAAGAAVRGRGQPLVPAADWLLDNQHVVEAQIRTIRADLPPGFYRELPKLADGPFAGYPRVFGLAWAFVAHTDSHFDAHALLRFVAAYQRVQPLTIGELWALAITLRLVLVENLRRLADQIGAGRAARADADALADRLLAPGGASAALDHDRATRDAGPLSELFAAELARRLRDQDPRSTPALGWLRERLAAQSLTLDEVVLHAQQRQGASNVSVRNVITSMRRITDADWSELFEAMSLVDARLRAGSGFAALDRATRNRYRGAIEQLARGSSYGELDIAALALAEAARCAGPHGPPDPAQASRASEPGWHLIDEGRRGIELVIGYRPPLALRLRRYLLALGLGGYLGALALLTALLTGGALAVLAAAGAGAGWLAAFGLLALLPASELATALAQRMVTRHVGPAVLPGIDLSKGVPAELRTVVAVPVLLTGEAELRAQIERLEVHWLSGGDGHVSFALLTDGTDAPAEHMPADAPLLALAAEAIAELNRRHGPGPDGDRFLLLHRRRRANPSEGCWMGWERKRGKLHELNRLLRGATDTSFVAVEGRPPTVPAGTRFVVTLDADTRLPHDTVARLVGKLAHPLNTPHLDAAGRRVRSGHAILQPRVTPALPVGRDGSPYQRLFAGAGGLDPYAAAASDLYQDLFGEGSYTGKGIYDIDAFEAALAGRVPDNSLLSHDLFEGVFARAALASDIEVVEEFPARHDVACRRQQRWMRGDWQLLPWLLAPGLPALGRWKMLDNLRRSLLAPATLAAFALAWVLPAGGGAAMALLLAAIALPPVLPVLGQLRPRLGGPRTTGRWRAAGADASRAARLAALLLVLLPDTAWRALDAIGRTLGRLFVTHRHLLEWTSSAEAGAAPRLDLRGFQRRMAGGSALTALLVGGALLVAPDAWPRVLPLALLWLAAPAVALAASRAPPAGPVRPPTEAETTALRLVARRTWRYFETFVTPASHCLPPDNFQETPRPQVAHRTSPTNIGLYLLSAVAARDFGWSGTTDTVERLEDCFATLDRLARHRGHFLNWYDTNDLRVLAPAYVSTVDSGNLAGHLVVLANACDDWRAAPHAPAEVAIAGCADALALARVALVKGGLAADAAAALAQALAALGTAEPDATAPAALAPTTAALDPGARSLVDASLADQAALLAPGATGAATGMAETAARLCRLADAASARLAAAPEPARDLAYWLDAAARCATGHARDQALDATAAADLARRLDRLAARARDFVRAMDFAFLLDPERQLLVIGHRADEHRHDPNCYDLLASEARLASLIAIAKGDVPARHWFRLGRATAPVGQGSALLSWSGSMFEYLMPSLVMRAPAGSLLEQTARLAVAEQQAYARRLGLPWGISESAYNARDLEFTYQYSNFGVPDLGLRPGLADDRVIAPYATGLATMVDPGAALANLAAIAVLGGDGRHGFHEALDFTRSRLPEDARVAVVRSYMAHHQGMTVVAIANALLDGPMRARFHREPMIQACELLLHERMPRESALPARPAAPVPGQGAQAAPASPRRVLLPRAGPCVSHLLSNGRYAVMLTATGGGYSRWRGLAVTRWQEDATRDERASAVFVRDARGGQTWSAAAGAGEAGSATFAEDNARFERRDHGVVTTLEVIVSGEDDGEVRRVTLDNRGRLAREFDLTSYAGIVLAPPADDDAHPAFSRLFVQTSWHAATGALIATRRPRSAAEAPAWAAHFAVVEGDAGHPPQHETDRARFLAGALTPAAAVAAGRALSGTVGSVLDPVFALRRRVRLAPGGMARVAFWTVVAPTRKALLDLIDSHLDAEAFARARTLAWTQAQVQLHHLGMATAEAADFQRLAAPLLLPDRRWRAPEAVIAAGLGPQPGLWPLAISGDLPIVVLRIDATGDLAVLRQLLRAHEYWRMKQLDVDLVVLNERGASYVQDLQQAIDTAVRSSQARPRPAVGDHVGRDGGVHVLRADLTGAEARALLLAAARLVIEARHGLVAEQIARLEAVAPALVAHAPPAARWFSGTGTVAAPRPAPEPSGPPQPPPGLERFNGYGGFALDGREYHVVLDGGRRTPAPWINVIANDGFGFHVSAEGAACTWAGNSRENRLTPWSNDALTDASGEALYLRDEASGELWCPTAAPLRDGGRHLACHGFGYSRFEHEAHGIAAELLMLVPPADPLRVARLKLVNRSGRARRLTVTTLAEWTLGPTRAGQAPFILTEHDEASGALLARNPWRAEAAGHVAFAHLGGRPAGWTADRADFLGHGGSLADPAGLKPGALLSGAAGAGLDPCAALQSVVEIAPGATVEVVALLGQAASRAEALALVARYRAAPVEALLAEVGEYWTGLLGAVQVRTPDRAMDLMLNGWLLYQTLACRITARAAFYQASGAWGFRDQLQDGMALALAAPGRMRAHLLRAAGRQFAEGDVQHWWLPGSGRGVRTRISDDRAWLAYATAHYVRATGDAAVLDERLPFLDGPPLGAHEEAAFFEPSVSGESATLFEHCARALDQCLALTGAHGLPLMGSGDWNDGMNRVGIEGRGESVWLGWLLIDAIGRFAPLAAGRAEDPGGARASRWRAHAARLREAIEAGAWDGDWYRRATWDDGAWLGAAAGDECRIDSIAQSWAVLSGAAAPGRARRAMAAFDRELVRRDDGLALLFAPPFDRTPRDPGYIKGYPPGLRENGGQYSHAAMWAVLAWARLGEGGRAAELFGLLNPLNHARDAAAARRYRVEPYVVAADVYSVAPHVGRGGWTWYTGSAAWMYRAGVEGILGLVREGDALRVAPCLPPDWPGFEATVCFGGARCEIVVMRGGGAGGGSAGRAMAAAGAEGRESLAGASGASGASGAAAAGMRARLDGAPVTVGAGGARVPLDGRDHLLVLELDARAGVPAGRVTGAEAWQGAVDPPQRQT